MLKKFKTLISLVFLGSLTLALSGCPSETHTNSRAALGQRDLSDSVSQRPASAVAQSPEQQDANEFFRSASQNGLSRAVNGLVEPKQHDCAEDVEGENCVSFNEEEYGEEGGKKLGDAVRAGMQEGTAAKKEAFFKQMAPLAIRIQTKTGMPASLLLAQWAQETGWGVGSSNGSSPRNDILEDHNIIAGHSCWTRSETPEDMAISEDLDLGVTTINTRCNVERPANEGGFYLSFDTFEEGAYAHVQNLLKNPGTADAYEQIRQIHSRAVENGQVADSLAMADGLSDYAADPNYVTSIKRLINDNDLQKFDAFSICGEMPNINVRHGGIALQGDGSGLSVETDGSGNPVSAGAIKGEPQVNWNECDGAGGVTAGYQGGRCASRRRMSQPFLEHFNNSFKPCVAQGSQAQGESKEIASIYIDHNGVAGDESHSNRSYHSVNRAIDISEIIVTYTDGSKKTFDASNAGSSESQFFSAFRSCWSNSVIEQGRPSSCPGSVPKGSIGHEDHDHKNHMHISLPFCPQKSGYYIK